ncbi:lycopene cyclase domain-containing protein [Agrococcus versicolor]|uniref:Lycopene cyclase domain-containing protein n=1 Tax=Agrococcus versicolor TaxID=501482 RepID=A0ABN3AY12_9MICO
MTYALLVVVFGAVSLVLLLVARRRMERGTLRAMLAAFVVLVALTVVFDSLMIAADLFSYGTDHLSGIYLWLAPLEDLSYPAVALAVVVAAWSLVPARPSRVTRPAAASGSARSGDVA